MKRSYSEPMAKVVEFGVCDVITTSNSLRLANNTDGFDDGDTLSALFDF